ncbi:MAG TPA: adenylate/guanylate cyclase domain-containing protein [Dehalococcoidia bacterium]|nr:adenylate/guanylate cyclase domain-containing protein [Dehalococcoidia bacterium]
MEQEIRFCTTADGVRIAYATFGQGPPLVRVAGWFSHLEFEWGQPHFLWRSLEALADSHLIVRYDGRGMGLSDRDIADFSVEAKLRDLEAVVDVLGLERFSLLGQSEGGATAIAYAVRYPERVERLVLYGVWGRPLYHLDRESHREAFEAAITLVRTGWGLDSPAARQYFAALFMPDADTEAMRLWTEMQRVCASPHTAAAFVRQLQDIDVTSLAPRIGAPTLVIHRRGDTAVPFHRGREVAALIPGARLLSLEGRNHVLLTAEPAYEKYVQAIREFLNEGRPRAGALSGPASGLVTILFTDMEGSTTLTQRLGDEAAQAILRAHNRIIRQALEEHEGSEIKHTGDGIMASFTSASKALRCAIAVQAAFARYEPPHPDAAVHLRIGLNAGEPVAEDADLFGTAVQLAARVCATAEPGQILATNVVRELAAGKGFRFVNIGDVELRGFEDPVRLYEVREA